MPRRATVLSLLRAGRSYEQIGAELGIAPGLAFLIATGLPADGSDVVGYDGGGRPGMLSGSSQHLANPKAIVPQRDEEIDAWMRRRAEGDAPMQRAAQVRSIEPPAIEGAHETDDVISVLGWDHGQVDYLLKELEATPSASDDPTEADAARRVAIVERIREMLVDHEHLEEELFWPKVRGWFADGDRVAEQARAQEREGEEALRSFTGLSAMTEEFDGCVKHLAKLIRTHVAFEDGVFLRVDDTVDERERNRVGRRMKQAKHEPVRETAGTGAKEGS